VTKNHYDVGVVGAGPVGLVAAVLLERKGFKVLIIEKGPRVPEKAWRGSTVHAPILDLYEEIGLLPAMLAEGIHVEELQYWNHGDAQPVRFHFDVLKGVVTHPLRLQFDQYRVVQLLRDQVDASDNCEAMYESEVVGFESADGFTAKPVDLHLSEQGQERRVDVDLLLGADGAHSRIRTESGIEFSGFTYPNGTLLISIDRDLAEDVPGLGPVSYWFSDTGKISIIKTPEIWRLSFQVKATTSIEEGRHLAVALARKSFDLDLKKSIRHVTLYRYHQRLAKQFNVGSKIVLLGDAAHLVSPTGGLGLNTGICDAFDLVSRVAEAFDSANASAQEDGAVWSRDVASSYGTYRRKAVSQTSSFVSQRSTNALNESAQLARDREFDHLRSMSVTTEGERSYLSELSMIDALRRFPIGGR
jgi:3-(3-hydroxy-phenyl)propionate hydroxylase